ncbi:MAG: hypothetical protein FD166_3755, partial [Bacteroidetes bacterium]
PGGHKLTVYTSSPNGNSDPNTANDSKAASFRSEQYAGFPFFEGFTAATFPPAGWDYISIDNPLAFMSRNGTVGGFGNSTGCAKMDVFSTPYSNFGQVDYLMSPNIDLTTAPATGTELTFSVAYRQYDAGTTEALKVLLSTNCGSTWTTIYNKSGSTLSTVSGYATTAFTPTASQWRKETVSLSPYVGQNVILAFATTCDFGNNIYFDDITLTNPTIGINENSQELSVSIYPNPASEFVTVSGELNNSAISVYSMMGTEVANIRNNGSTTIDINISEYPSGIYFVQVKTETGTAVRKIVVSR